MAAGKNLLLIIFATDCKRLMHITTTPNVIHKIEGIFAVQEDLLSLIKQSGGRMYAKAQALVAPISSNTAPRSHVIKDRATEVRTREVVKIR